MHNSSLHIVGCRQHNLKNCSLTLPKEAIIVITGVSGSGKSSLAFDTIYAEGQRRYMESLSPEARQWLKQLPKPDVDLIEGLSPTLAISQNRNRFHPHATVATHTDIYDLLCLLYTHCGKQYNPTTGKRLHRYTRQEIIETLLTFYPPNARIQLLAPVKLVDEPLEKAAERLRKMGFIRLKVGNREIGPDEMIPEDIAGELSVVVDRIVIKEGVRDRLSSSVETALELGRGMLGVQEGKQGKVTFFPEVYVCPDTGFSFAPLSSRDFNFHSVHGACPSCQGRGGKEQVDVDHLKWLLESGPLYVTQQVLSLFPKKKRVLYEAVWEAFLAEKSSPSPTLADILSGYSGRLVITTEVEGKQCTVSARWKGLVEMIEEELKEKGSRSRFIVLDYVGWQTCSECHGARLKAASRFCRIADIGIHELCAQTVSEALLFLKSWSPESKNKAAVEAVMPETIARLRFLEDVGLGYLQLDRHGTTLSEGEAQRVQLASQIGAKLSGVLYVLDEPSLGLHRLDLLPLAKIIEELRDLGNTVIVVEHDPTLIRLGEQIVELGPGAGRHGGSITFQGAFSELLKDKTSLTGKWLAKKESYKSKPRKKTHHKTPLLQIGPISLHNLSDFSVDIPLNSLVGVCGVSGSGKSTLIMDFLANHMRRHLQGEEMLNLPVDLNKLVLIGQGASGVSMRSIPATYAGIMTPLRRLLAQTTLARARGYTTSRFSLNKRGGRCEACEGLGKVRLSMQFLPDIEVTCDACEGKRFHFETLQVTWEGHSIADILDMSVEEAFSLFQNIPEIAEKLALMAELGLDYLLLGQPFSTLSGGEMQRLKLVADLAKPSLVPTLYLLDEPCRGLHFSDVEKLSRILQRLASQGHSVIVVEHNLDLLMQTDWLIELGPGGGPQGGRLVFEGAPAELAKTDSPTARAVQA